jgi:hypothetical protein
MTGRDPFGDEKLKRINLILYLIPLVGWILSALTLSQKQSEPQKKKVSRISLNLTLGWFLFYILLWTGSTFSGDSYSLRLLYMNGLLTTGYIVISLTLMWRIWQGKSINLLALKAKQD